MDKIAWCLCFFASGIALGAWVSTPQQPTTSVDCAPAKELPNKQMTDEPSSTFEKPHAPTQTQAQTKNARIQEIVRDPEVRSYLETEIERRAEQKAKLLTQENIATYKKNEKQKKEEEVQTYMDDLESFFMDSVDVFAQEYGVEPTQKAQLSTLIEQGFEKQRVLYKQLTSQEISDDEYKKLSAESKQEDRQLIVKLLGEEGAKDFSAILKEEGEKARNRK